MMYQTSLTLSKSVPSILLEIEATLDKTETSLKLKHRVVFIAMEMLQNGVNLGENQSSGCYLSLIDSSDFYEITTTNIISALSKNELRNRLDLINALDKPKLKHLYLTRLKEGVMMNGKSGLGLIQIARKSASKLQGSFQDIDNQYSLFQLRITLSKN